MTAQEAVDFVNKNVNPEEVDGPMEIQAQGAWGFTWADGAISGAVLFQTDGSIVEEVDVCLNDDGTLENPPPEGVMPYEWRRHASLEVWAKVLASAIS